MKHVELLQLERTLNNLFQNMLFLYVFATMAY